MKRYILKGWVALVLVSLLSTSCVNDLDTIPLDKNTITSATFYDSAESYRQVLAKIYGRLCH